MQPYRPGPKMLTLTCIEYMVFNKSISPFSLQLRGILSTGALRKADRAGDPSSFCMLGIWVSKERPISSRWQYACIFTILKIRSSREIGVSRGGIYSANSTSSAPPKCCNSDNQDARLISLAFWLFGCRLTGRCGCGNRPCVGRVASVRCE